MLDAHTQIAPESQLADLELEKTLLSAVLYDAKSLDKVGDLQAEDFANPVNGEMFAAMQNLRKERQPINSITLRGLAGMSAMGREAIMGQLRALSFAGELPNVADLSRQLTDFSVRRQLLDLHRRYQYAATDSSQTVTAQLASLRVETDTLVARMSAQGKTRLTHKDATIKMLGELKRDLSDVLVPTGIGAIDRGLAGGLRRGDYAVLAGRPGSGKSTLGLAIAIGAARQGHGVLYFTPEMTTDQLMIRAAALTVSTRDAPVPYEHIMSKWDRVEPNLAAREQALFYRAMNADDPKNLPGWPVYYDEQTNLLASEIQARVKQARIDFQEAGFTLDMVIVDHMGKVRPTNRYKGNKVQEVGEVSEAMAVLGKEENVAMVALHQLNRAVESRENKRPQLADLRNSGDVEQDADLVMFAYREAYYLEQKPEGEGTDKEMARLAQLRTVQNDLELLVAKNRRGRTGVVKLYCDVSCNLVMDV